jgi:two-component system chemotaxis response regulator CheY
MSLKMLVVDDSPTVRAVIKRTLNVAGVQCDEICEAGNGVEALQLLRQSAIDVVITDLNMPEMSGAELIQEMQADARLKKIPTIVVSTEGSKTRLNELHQKGISACLRKPFTPEQFNEVIHRVLEQTHESRI